MQIPFLGTRNVLPKAKEYTAAGRGIYCQRHAKGFRGLPPLKTILWYLLPQNTRTAILAGPAAAECLKSVARVRQNRPRADMAARCSRLLEKSCWSLPQTRRMLEMSCFRMLQSCIMLSCTFWPWLCAWACKGSHRYTRIVYGTLKLKNADFLIEYPGKSKKN